MKKLLLAITVLSQVVTLAQEMPKKSQMAEVEQQVGLTEIEVTYSRPNQQEREIFGKLLPYGELWRLGANKATSIEFSTDVDIKGTKVKAGKYAMFATPLDANSWDFVLNSNTEQWGTGEYDGEKDVLRVKLKVNNENTTRESMLFYFDKLTHNYAELVFEWENSQVIIPIKMDTDAEVKKMIASAEESKENLADVYFGASRYYERQTMDYESAMKYAQKYLKLKEDHKGYFQLAQVEYKTGKKDKAMEHAKKAHDLAVKAESTGWADYIKGTITEWEGAKK